MTIILPTHIVELVELQAKLYREAPVENKYPLMESHTALQWLATDTKEEYEAANLIYRNLAEI